MKKYLYFLFSSSCPLLGAAALSLGYRSDSIDWNKSSLNQHWDSQRLVTIGFNGSHSFKRALCKVDADFGYILAGDFYSCNLFDEFDFLSVYGLAPQKKATPHGFTARVKGAIGISYLKGCITTTPLFGWSYFHQNLHTKTLTSRTKVLIDEKQFDSASQMKQTLKTNWQGPFLGCDLLLAFDARLNLFGHLEIHFDKFRGVAKNKESLSLIEKKETTYLKKNNLSVELEGGLNCKITSCALLFFTVEYTHLFNNNLLHYHSLNFKLGLSKTF